jgi:MOSC domain-containing protein YiiM
VGDQLRVGDCLIQISKVREPCRSLNQWHPQLLKLIIGHSGWLARVIEPAVVREGDGIEVIKAKVKL